MKFVLVIVLLLSVSCTNNSKKINSKAWTKEFEQGLYNYLDSTAKESVPDAEERKEYNEYFIERLKEEIPDGWNSVSKDSLKSLNIKITREYVLKRKKEGKFEFHSRRVNTAWSPFVEKSFRENYLAIFEKYTKPSINDFCDCTISELKNIYPDSILIPVPKDIMTKVALDCKKHLKEDSN
jgi:hypothetical protein